MKRFGYLNVKNNQSTRSFFLTKCFSLGQLVVMKRSKTLERC